MEKQKLFLLSYNMIKYFLRSKKNISKLKSEYWGVMDTGVSKVEPARHYGLLKEHTP